MDTKKWTVRSGVVATLLAACFLLASLPTMAGAPVSGGAPTPLPAPAPTIQATSARVGG